MQKADVVAGCYWVAGDSSMHNAECTMQNGWDEREAIEG